MERLADTLDRLAWVIQRDLGSRVQSTPGGGASGGLGAGPSPSPGDVAPRSDVVMDYLDLAGALAGADLVITAEGSLDVPTPNGKVPAEVGRWAAALGVPVIALAGTIGADAQVNLDHGISLQRPGSLQEAIGRAAELVADAAEQEMRLLVVGQRMADRLAVAVA